MGAEERGGGTRRMVGGKKKPLILTDACIGCDNNFSITLLILMFLIVLFSLPHH